MDKEGEPQDSRAELYEAIGHPTRIRILQVLEHQPMGFAELKRAVGIESSGNMSFHLTKLRNLVTTAPDGDYVLTDDGREALWSIGTISRTSLGPRAELQVRRVRRNRQKIVLSSLIVAVILLSSFAVIQQQQITTQQEQITSELQRIALYVKGTQPFSNAQGASLVLGQKDFVTYSSAQSGDHLDTPAQVLSDQSGNMWVVDMGNDRVLEFRPPFSTGMQASLVIGQKDFSSTTRATTIDGLGARVSGVGTVAQVFGPGAAAFDSSGDLWVADSGNSRVLEFRPPFANGMPASLVIGQRSFTTRIQSLTGNGLSYPGRPVFDLDGNLWVLDQDNDRVLEFKPPFSNGMNASVAIGQSNFVDGVASTSQSGLDCTTSGDIAIDPSGNLWVGDGGNNRVLEFKAPFRTGMNASIVIGQPDFTTKTRTSEPGYEYGLYLGWAIAFDPAGNLWATSNHRLLEYRGPFHVAMDPSLEIGQPDFTTTAWVGGQNGLVVPNIPGFDSSGNLWVPDGYNNRVLEFVPASLTTNAQAVVPAAQILTQFQLEAVVAGMIVVTVAAVVWLAVKRRDKK